ncbi:transposase, partial [Pelagibius litoralis]|nr:transposase [Pelagibius litoralis]
MTDQIGRPLAFTVTPGQTHDLDGAAALLRRIPTPRQLIADRAYDAR